MTSEAKDLIARLEHARTTAANDDTSEPMSEKRLRHTERLSIVVDDPEPETEGEFFVLRLKDKHSKAALLAYADSVRWTDPEFAIEVSELAARAGVDSPWCKEPD